MDLIDERREMIRRCVLAIQEKTDFGKSFILVGGAGSMLAGSNRLTDDVDLLIVTGSDLHKFRNEILAIEGFEAPGGVLTFRGRMPLTIDFLNSTVLDKTFDDLKGHTFTRNGVRLLEPDVALAIKLHCVNKRAEDGNGAEKRNTDLHDVRWISETMAKQTPPMVISDKVANNFQIGHYSLLLTRMALEDGGFTVENLVAVGVTRMLRPWTDDTPEQKEYFEFFAAPGACPLTCELLTEEEDGTA